MTNHYTPRGATVIVSGDLDVSAPDPSRAGAIIHRVHAANIVAVAPGTPAVFASGTDTSTKRPYEVTVDAMKCRPDRSNGDGYCTTVAVGIDG